MMVSLGFNWSFPNCTAIFFGSARILVIDKNSRGVCLDSLRSNSDGCGLWRVFCCSMKSLTGTPIFCSAIIEHLCCIEGCYRAVLLGLYGLCSFYCLGGSGVSRSALFSNRSFRLWFLSVANICCAIGHQSLSYVLSRLFRNSKIKDKL